MKYETLSPISYASANKILSDKDNYADQDLIANVLLRCSMYLSNWKWVQNFCIQFLNSDDFSIESKYTIILCFSHIVRRFKTIDVNLVLPILNKLKNISFLEGRIEDVIDDIELYINQA